MWTMTTVVLAVRVAVLLTACAYFGYNARQKQAIDILFAYLKTVEDVKAEEVLSLDTGRWGWMGGSLCESGRDFLGQARYSIRCR